MIQDTVRANKRIQYSQTNSKMIRHNRPLNNNGLPVSNSSLAGNFNTLLCLKLLHN